MTAVLLPVQAHALLGAILGEKFPFKVAIESAKGVADDAEDVLSTQRKESAQFKELEHQRAAARFDRDVLERWLHSQGYFSAEINSEFSGEDIIHRVKLGELYLVKDISLTLPAGVESPPIDILPLQQGQPLKAENVLASASALEQYVLENYCLYEVAADYDAQINRATAKAFVSFSIKPSPEVAFAEPEVSGLTTIERDYLDYQITFEQGECFNRRKIERSRLAMLQTNLFARVDVSIEPPQNGQVKVIYDVTERNHRTLKAGVGFDTNKGPGLSLGWEHRNLKHRGQRLSVDSRISDLEKNIVAELAVPNFLREEQTLIFRSDIVREDTDAYEETSGEIGVQIERRLHRNLSGSVGTTLEYNRVLNLTAAQTEDNSGEPAKSNTTLLSFPLNIDYLDTNNLLNPTRGWGVGLSVQPFIDLQNNNAKFAKTTIAATQYWTASEVRTTPTLALRLATGTISGAQKKQVPINHRFFVGGGGSVRGYGYQAVGDLVEPEELTNDEGKPSALGAPDGGLSFSEVSLELRLRFSESWGGVLFTDGGYAYNSETPSFSDEFLWGAGIGLRYFTSFAPIRVDVAVPLNRGERGRFRSVARVEPYDDAVQLYISIGQSF